MIEDLMTTNYGIYSLSYASNTDDRQELALRVTYKGSDKQEVSSREFTEGRRKGEETYKIYFSPSAQINYTDQILIDDDYYEVISISSGHNIYKCVTIQRII